MRLPDALLHTLLTDPDPYWQSIEQHAWRPVGAFAPLHAPEQYRPEDDVIPPRGSRQHQRPRQVAQTRRTHTERSRYLPQAAGQPYLNFTPRLSDARSVAMHIDQPVRRRRL